MIPPPNARKISHTISEVSALNKADSSELLVSGGGGAVVSWPLVDMGFASTGDARTLSAMGLPQLKSSINDQRTAGGAHDITTCRPTSIAAGAGCTSLA